MDKIRGLLGIDFLPNEDDPAPVRHTFFPPQIHPPGISGSMTFDADPAWLANLRLATTLSNFVDNAPRGGTDMAMTQVCANLQAWAEDDLGVIFRTDRSLTGENGTAIGAYNPMGRVVLVNEMSWPLRTLATIHECCHVADHLLCGQSDMAIPSFLIGPKRMARIELVAETVTHMALRRLGLDHEADIIDYIPGSYRTQAIFLPDVGATDTMRRVESVAGIIWDVITEGADDADTTP